MPRLALSSGSRRAPRRDGPPRDAAGGTDAPGIGAATSGVPATLRAMGVRPSRRLGQNFLIDPRVAERIAALVEDAREPVIEIGPGLGALTMLLAT
ncbi:MAG TPA: rRNA adenine N-6-methyltransferase family protein, partial [Candidatus Eisenbacteria bacterium]|nr:rRNA adenine N-6-methyltransferase family protein [Candidatus Eisenbacteria bacterium]